MGILQVFGGILMGCINGKSPLTEEDMNYIARNTAMDKDAVEVTLPGPSDGTYTKVPICLCLKNLHYWQIILGFSFSSRFKTAHRK